MPTGRRVLLSVLLLIAASAVLASLAPEERVLGAHVRVVYLHGAWVWTALLTFAAAAVAGALGLLTRDERPEAWSVGLGRAGALFWGTSLVLSLWAMQSNWNGLFLAEPRWRLAVEFSIIALLLQVASTLIRRLGLASALNVGFVAALLVALARTDTVMHPRSPINLASPAPIQLTLGVLLLLTLTASWQLAGWLRPSGWGR